jgi:hypothetical protein
MHKIGDVFLVENVDLRGNSDWFIITDIVDKDQYYKLYWTVACVPGTVSFEDVYLDSENTYCLYNHNTPIVKLPDHEALYYKIKYV